ncbi:helix-turn-helix domain-containing protein [Oceanirhabdus sp. W0125-5]|uniref:helix-turn-helix domain-containing protein n=1 Tax=Oceanirhabdus sp. W0125-5 TaxID=2999116 RepID=UPI0022F33882|nr:helix-turn-helix domain-containing protein [Oceanirhabdus sp. W0125-5]WBW99179.1 helix-turn-helix domain-containing protein [Oceanirhabdus sp. W0125-5]
MNIINDKRLIKEYVSKYSIDKFFSNDMMEHFVLHKYNTGDFLCLTGEPFDYLQFLVKGKCKISIFLRNGKSLLLGFGSPLTLIGDLEIANNTLYDCNLQCIDEIHCVSIPVKIIKEYCNNDPIFWHEICKSLSRKLITASTTHSINLLYSLESRLASYLIAISSSYNKNKTRSIDIQTSKLSDIADLLGTSYRHLARTISKLCEKGILSRSGKAIVVEDYEALSELAGDIYI